MKKNIFPILLLCNLLVFGFLFSAYKLKSKLMKPETLFIVEYIKGSK